MFVVLTVVLAIIGFIYVGWWMHRLWPRELPAVNLPDLLTWSVENGTQRVSVRGSVVVGSVHAYGDELYAFLMYDYLRSRPAFSQSEVFLDYDNVGGVHLYRIQVSCSANLLNCVPWLFQLENAGLAESPTWAAVPKPAIARARQQTALFAEAYSKPVGHRFDTLSPAQRVRYVRRWLQFKSSTDPRIRRGAADLEPLSKPQAAQLSADIITVADFYDLPLEVFLGIGAMENNYLSARGDLDHAVWKRHAEPGDIVIRRTRHRVLVKNFSIGVWQITRETLRRAQALYLADTRDYSRLPERLRPPRKLDIDNVSPEVLTTYAGLLLRNLLDYFHGDVAQAVGAYNGGVANPNQRYASGVSVIAEYARRILGRAAAMKDAEVESIRD